MQIGMKWPKLVTLEILQTEDDDLDIPSSNGEKKKNGDYSSLHFSLYQWNYDDLKTSSNNHYHSYDTASSNFKWTFSIFAIHEGMFSDWNTHAFMKMNTY